MNMLECDNYFQVSKCIRLPSTFRHNNVIAHVQTFARVSVFEGSAVRLACVFWFAVHHRAEGELAIVGAAGVAAVVKGNAVLGRRTSVHAGARHAVLVAFAIRRALFMTIFLRASTQHTAVGQTNVAPWNMEVKRTHTRVSAADWTSTCCQSD